MEMQNIQASWESFNDFFAKEILPIYESHEKNFDFFGFHGRRHITRSVIIAEVMARFYAQLGEEIDFEGIRIAVSFHDSAREANGPDYWELESSENCLNYLISAGKSAKYARLVAKTILAKKDNVSSRLEQIVYDADVLEIMRLFVDKENGLDEFRKGELFFLGENKLHQSLPHELTLKRKKVVKEAWFFIRKSEQNRPSLSNKEYLPSYRKILRDDFEIFPFMNHYLPM